jgi:dTDP-4-amino-4,6-dideoxygalactose transaminase
MIQPRVYFTFPKKYRKVFRMGKKQYCPESGEYLLNHNRAGLLLALKALQLPQGSIVGVMAYNCHTVMNAVADAGYQVGFLDVTKDLVLDLEDLRKKRDRLSAVIVSHLFGIANDVDAVRKICPNMPVIEDCAHAFGMKQCGKTGDFAVYSIGAGKFPSVGEGGILMVNRLDYRPAIERLLVEIQPYSSKQERRLFRKLQVLNWLYTPFVYSYLTLPLLKRNNKKIASAREEIKVLIMSKGISAVYNEILPYTEQMKEQQQAFAACLIGYFKDKKGVCIVNNNPTESNCFMFPLYCDNPVELKMNLRRCGIEAETHFRHCLIWGKEYGYQEKDCPQVEDLTQHLLMIPTYKNFKL